MSDSTQETAHSGADHLFPIRAVAQMTGVNPITLRAWERRYGLICPTRTESGHRLYSAGDIQAIRQAQTLSAQGITLPQIAQILQRPATTESAITHPAEPTQGASPWTERFKKATLLLDPLALRQTEQDALMWLSAETVIRDGLIAALSALEQREAWPDRDIGLIWLTQHIRQRLDWWLLLQARRPDQQHPLILVDSASTRVWCAREFSLVLNLARQGTIKLLPIGLDETQRHRLVERWQATHWLRLMDPTQSNPPPPSQFSCGTTRMHWCQISEADEPHRQTNGLHQGGIDACAGHFQQLFHTH